MSAAAQRADGPLGAARRYPPLLMVVAALALAIFALPSALNLPQANPGQTVEYAPVPGDNGQAPPGGNVAGLGLGSDQSGPGSGTSGGGTGEGAPGQGLQNQPPPVSQKQCVGSPPRQTEDPLSPPCVAFFKGDNGGATWVGVTGTEINVVFRFLELQGDCRSGVVASNSCPPGSGFYDMDKPSDYSQYFLWDDLHNWEKYFNQAYQTYGRHVHFYAQNYGDTQDYVQNGGYPPSKASAQAAEAWTTLHPFADVDRTNLYSDTYTSYLVQHQGMSFGFISQQLASQYAGHYWSYSPPLEYVAQDYATFVCTRVIGPGKVTFSGNNDTGSPRKYGLLLTDDPTAVDYRKVQDLAVQDMKSMCGFNPTDTKYFHYCCGYNITGPNSGWGTTNMAQFKAEGITTVIWPGGEESEDMIAADKLQWYPEWMLLGDGGLDGNLMSAEPTKEITNAWVASPITLQNTGGQPVEPACLDALLQVNPSISRSGSDIALACDGPYTGNEFDDIRQLFTGIQLAGPKLTPTNMDQGFHAIPAKPSTGPTQPACYYLPGDYTCVKDAVAEWFDTNTPEAASDSTGCWRMWRGGARFLPGHWPSGDVQDHTSADICNLFAGGLQAGIRPPG
jgi:hypothetical protein